MRLICKGVPSQIERIKLYRGEPDIGIRVVVPRVPLGLPHLSGILHAMTNALKVAIMEVEQLPAADQEHIGRQVIEHVEKLRSLRADIGAGLQSLDVGNGRELDMRDVITRAHAQQKRA